MCSVPLNKVCSVKCAIPLWKPCSDLVPQDMLNAQYPTAEPLFLTAYLIPQSAVPEIITLFTYLGEITFLES